MSVDSKIEWLSRRLQKAEQDVVAGEKPNDMNFHYNLEAIHRRDKIARELLKAKEQVLGPQITRTD